MGHHVQPGVGDLLIAGFAQAVRSLVNPLERLIDVVKESRIPRCEVECFLPFVRVGRPIGHMKGVGRQISRRFPLRIRSLFLEMLDILKQQFPLLEQSVFESLQILLVQSSLFSIPGSAREIKPCRGRRG